MAKRKGKVFRPCYVCSQSVNFVPWLEESKARGRNIWHWANEDGSHHVHLKGEYKDDKDSKGTDKGT